MGFCSALYLGLIEALYFIGYPSKLRVRKVNEVCYAYVLSPLVAEKVGDIKVP
jgi:hypothetical protein